MRDVYEYRGETIRKNEVDIIRPLTSSLDDPESKY